MKQYTGTKTVMAEPETKDGKEGYKVQYEDSYISWSPKEVFEQHYHEDKRKIMISQPMNGLTNAQIEEAQQKFNKFAVGNNFVIVNTFFKNCFDEIETGEYKVQPLWYLSKAIEKMAKCDVVYFCTGWEEARGCKIEHEVAVAYGLEVIYEEG